MAKVELKQPIVEEIANSIKDAQAVVLVNYSGLIQSHIIQSDILINTEQNQLSHDSLGITEWNTVIYQIICCIGCIGKSVVCGQTHFTLIKLHGCEHSGK